jgi:hypothetical protein
MSTRGKGYAFRQKPKEAQFCPWCGVRSLVRDFYLTSDRESKIAASDLSPEWICTTCGTGFQLKNSARSNLAIRMLREASKLRVNP